MGGLEKILIIVIIIIAIIVLLIFAPNRNNNRCVREERRKKRKITSTCHNSQSDNVRMKLSATRKLATFSISLDRPDVKSAYIMYRNEVLADITSDFVNNTGVANGFWRLDERQAQLLESGFVNIKVIFNDEGTVTMKVE